MNLKNRSSKLYLKQYNFFSGIKKVRIILFILFVLFGNSNTVLVNANEIPYNPKFPKAKYPYAQAPDGCSGLRDVREVRDTWGPVNFKPTCNEHDRCYYTYGSSWQNCNEQFRIKLLKACKDGLTTNTLGIRVSGEKDPRFPVCASIATGYYAGVQAGVMFDVFKDAQKKQKEYEQYIASIRQNENDSTISSSLAHTFGYIKNSRLVATGKSPEPMSGHVNWAMNTGQSLSTVENEIRSDLAQARASIARSPSSRSCEAFGYMKNGMLTLLRGTTEPHQGHVNWCRDRLNDGQWNQVVSAMDREFVKPIQTALK